MIRLLLYGCVWGLHSFVWGVCITKRAKIEEANRISSFRTVKKVLSMEREMGRIKDEKDNRNYCVCDGDRN